MSRFGQRKFLLNDASQVCVFAEVLQSYGVARSGEVHANLGRHAHLAVTPPRLFCSPPVRFQRSARLSLCYYQLVKIYIHTHSGSPS